MPELAFGGFVHRTIVEVVRRKLVKNIVGKNLGPRLAPDMLRKDIIIWAELAFDLPRQCSSQSAVAAIGPSVFLEVGREFGSTSHGLEPLELITGAADQAQYTSGHTNGKWSGVFVTAYIDISEGRRVQANDLKKLWHDTVGDCFSSEGLDNQFGVVGISQLDQGRASKVRTPSNFLNERFEWFRHAEPPDD